MDLELLYLFLLPGVILPMRGRWFINSSKGRRLNLCSGRFRLPLLLIGRGSAGEVRLGAHDGETWRYLFSLPVAGDHLRPLRRGR